MNDNVIMLPPISDQRRLAEYYSMADVFVICSKRENFPTTCIESQCCGTPIVGFDTGGTSETSVLSKEDFVSYGDINGLRDLIADKLSKTKCDTSQRAQKMYSKESMTENYIREYDGNGYSQRVLLVDVNCKKSSTGKIVYDLYQNLRKNGRDAAICYGRGDLVREDNIYKFGLDWETYMHAFLARVTGYNGCFSFFSTKRLIKYIEEYEPDTIHIHELHAYFVNIKQLLKYIKKKKINVVWTFHCEYMYTGKCGHAYECTRYQTECGNCPAVTDYPRSIFFDRTKKMFRMKKMLLEDLHFSIITPSAWLANRVKKSFLKEKKVEIIHNGIDTSIFSKRDTRELRKRLNIPNDNKIVLAVAPDIMSEKKGGEWVLDLAEMMKDSSITFILVGVENG